MLIDWFTVAAQMVNFLILVALLKRFLYGPIIKAMADREAGIAARLEEARRQAEAAELVKDELREKNRAFEKKSTAMLAAARQEAEDERSALLRQTREEAEHKRMVWEEALQREQTAFRRQWRLHAGSQFVQVARQALGGLAEAELEQQMVQVFLKRLGALPENLRQDLSETIRRSGSQISIASSFEISPESRFLLEKAVRNRLASAGTFQYRIAASLLCGIELTADGLRVGWNLEDYLGDLEAGLNLELGHKMTSAPSAGIIDGETGGAHG